MRKITFIIVLLLPICLLSQTDWTVIEPTDFLEELRTFEESILEGESYSFSTDYSIYNDFADVLPIKTYSGHLICREGIDFNISQMDYFVVQNEHYNVSIDSVNNQLMVQFADPSFSYRKTVEDYSGLSEVTQEIKKKLVGDKKLYSLTLKQGYPYHSMEYTFTKDNLISEVVIYGNGPYLSEDEDYDSAKKSKVVIRFSNFKVSKNVDLKEFTPLENYIIIINDDEIKPVGKYQKYEILDLREQN